MGKDAYWFSHDSNAKDDPKIMLLIDQLGLEGYGIYWLLVETLREQAEYRYPIKLLPVLAKRYQTSGEKMYAVVKSYSLFTIDGEDFFFSESLNRRMKAMDAKRKQARAAVQSRWEKQLLQDNNNQRGGPQVDTDVIRTYYGSNTIRVNKSKVKDNIKKDVKGQEVFEVFRQHYPGRKRGSRTEFDNFEKKNRDWESVLSLLLPAIEKQIEIREKKKAAGGFTPEWKDLSTWINRRSWEEEEVTEPSTNTTHGSPPSCIPINPIAVKAKQTAEKLASQNLL